MSLFPPGKTAEDIEKVYLEAYQQTKIVYKGSAGFFSPRLKNLNHLEVGSPNVMNNYLVFLIEYLLGLYENTVAWLKNMIKELYPRTNRFYGKAKDSYVIGNLTFSKKNDAGTPLHNMPVQLWARTRLGAWRLFSQGHSDREGVFKLDFDYQESRRWRYRSFHFEIHQVGHVFFDSKDMDPSVKLEIFERIKIPKGDLRGLGFNMGTLQLCYWEYRDDMPIPRVLIKDHDEDAPEYYSDGRNNAIQHQFVPIQLTKNKHLAQIKYDPHSISIESIQRDYPKNLTRAMEEMLPYSTRCDYWFGRRMMNGMNAATFLPDPIDENRYWVRYFGSCDYQVNDEYAFPTVEIKFQIWPVGFPIPEMIITTGQISLQNKDPYTSMTAKPIDGEKWEQAKRVARVSGALCTELDDHFAGTHANIEQYAIAARRNLRLNPLTILLFPHLKEVALINHAADDLLIGKGYISRASALSPQGIIDRCSDLMGVLDWKNWKPMAVINDSHTYAKAENLFWEVVGEFVDSFFNHLEEEILAHWHEIFRLSEDLVNHSVPVYHSQLDWDTIPAWAKSFEEKRIAYYQSRFRFDPGLPRNTYNGIKRVISPITKNPVKPDPGDMQNLKDVSRYAIMHATFMHTWVNEHQYEDIGEILYSCLGLRYGNHRDGIFRPESDHSISPDLTISTQMMWFSNLLSRTEYGFITRNEENDTDPLFAKLLQQKKSEFEDLYVDINNIESRTNI